MRVTQATAEAIKYACLKFHYAKAIPVNTIGYNVYNDKDEWCGCILYGTGANYHIGDEYGLVQGQALELVRVALNGKQEHTSQAVAMSLKQLHKDCPLCKLVVSYADSDQNHLGTIYQATNWVYVGSVQEGQPSGAWYINGKKTHNKTISGWIKTRGGLKGLTQGEYIKKYFDPNAIQHIAKGKRKYLMPLDKKTKKKIMALSKPYPKNEDWVKIDRGIFRDN